MDAFQRLGIDLNGLVIYLVNFGVILVVLTKYLYKPLTKYVDERRETIQRNLAEAEALKNAFREEMLTLERKQEVALRDLRQELAKAKAYAEEKAKAAVAEVQAERARIIQDAEKQAERLKRDMVAEAEVGMLARMKEVVAHVVRGAVPAEAVGKSVEEAWRRANKA